MLQGLKQREALGREPGPGMWRLSGQTHGQRGSLQHPLTPAPKPCPPASVTWGSAAILGYKSEDQQKESSPELRLEHRRPKSAAGHGLAAASVAASLLQRLGAECPGVLACFEPAQVSPGAIPHPTSPDPPVL